MLIKVLFSGLMIYDFLFFSFSFQMDPVTPQPPQLQAALLTPLTLLLVPSPHAVLPVPCTAALLGCLALDLLLLS